MRFFVRAIMTICASSSLMESACGVVGEDVLPQAHWISANPPGETDGTVFFHKTFTAPPRLVKAVLLGACDERMTIWINGEKAAEITGFARAATCDVTRQVRAGNNLIAVRLENARHLPAMRVLLELATERGRQSWLVSDGSWLSSIKESAGWLEVGFEADGWRPAFAHGAAGLRRWGDAFHATKSPDVYNSWMLASGAPQATDPATLTIPPGFRIELLRSAQPGEDSWIGLAFDSSGRITIAREQRGLLRFTLGDGAVEKVEVIEETLLECRGLLYAHDSLYVNANNSKGFYRLRDTDNDGRFDEKQLLLATRGGVGHGRNHITLGPDGMLYLVHGNDVELPADFASGSPLAHFAPDQLFPQRWGEHGSTESVRPPHGHILQTDPEGRTWRLIAGGLRNALDVAFNEDGEMFTYDADNERDIAAPWYRPTRILHVIPGGEYGWRPGAGKWPAYLPDTLPSAVDIGVGSPCGIAFGTHSRFPAPYRRALFVGDWAYGRILAIHLEPQGATYRGEAKPFVAGRPLNVTDIAFGPDGAMYFVTGGRRTQSGLYRVSYTAAEPVESERMVTSPTPERTLRKKLEALGGTRPPIALAMIWPALGHVDHWVRTAARVALEQQPLSAWEDKTFAETETERLLTAMLALARVGGADVHPRLLSRLLALSVAELSDEQKLRVVRVYTVSFARAGRPSVPRVAAIVSQLEPIYPAKSVALNHELCRLLTYLRAESTIEKTMPLLAAATKPEDILHYLWHLRHLGEGWTIERRRTVFESLRRAEQHQGARDYLQALRDVRKDFTTALSAIEQEGLGNLLVLAPSAIAIPPIDSTKYQFNRAWTIEDFPPQELRRAGSAEEGREAFVAAQCILCHRAGADAGGTAGPALTGIGSRFGRRDLLEQILEPSKVIDEKYRNVSVTLKDGTTYVGIVESETERELGLSIGTSVDDAITIAKSSVVGREPSAQSPMPAGLLNILDKQQILNLLSYLQAAP